MENILNRNIYKWNPVFNLVMEIKDKIIKLNKIKNIYDPYTYLNDIGEAKTITCLEYWLYLLNDDKYKNIFAPLQINQDETLILLRYGNYLSVKDGEDENKNVWDKDFWSLFNGLYCECRSIVIDLKEEVIVNCPFKKFFNLNEQPETMLDRVKEKIKEAKEVEISEKIDGSMQTATYYNEEIILTGAQALNQDKSWRLRDGYDMLFANENYIKMIVENPNWSFIFEYISLKDAHVVKYTKEQEGLYLIGIRDKITGEQYSYHFVLNIAMIYHIEKHTVLLNQTLDEVLNNLDKYKSNEHEGVVLFIDGFQVKIKYNDYVQIHRVLSKIASVNLIIESIVDGWYDDLKSKVPLVYRERLNEIYNKMSLYYKIMDDNVNKYYKEVITNVQDRNNIKEIMLYIDNNVPQKYRSYIRNKYLNIPYNYFKNKNGKYITAKELDINNGGELANENYES